MLIDGLKMLYELNQQEPDDSTTEFLRDALSKYISEKINDENFKLSLAEINEIYQLKVPGNYLGELGKRVKPRYYQVYGEYPETKLVELKSGKTVNSAIYPREFIPEIREISREFSNQPAE